MEENHIQNPNNQPFKELLIISPKVYMQIIALYTSIEKMLYNSDEFHEFMKGVETLKDKAISWINKNHEKILNVVYLANAICVLGNNQFVMPKDINYKTLEEIAKASNIDNILLFIMTENNNYKLNKMISYIEKHKLIIQNKTLFNEAIDSFKNGKYTISIVAFLVIIDNLLTLATNNPKTSILNRFTNLEQKIQNSHSDIEYKDIVLIYSTLKEAIEILGANVDFQTNKRPKGLNRHTIIHGRDTKPINQLDCIKVLRIIEGVLFLYDICEENSLAV